MTSGVPPAIRRDRPKREKQPGAFWRRVLYLLITGR